MGLSIGDYVGYNPEAFAQAAKGAETIKTTKAATNANPAVVAQALANQTGGNIMGFTYE